MESVRLAAYDPAWRRLFEQEADRLHAQLGPRALAIEHVGSTAVPGMEAKPILDVLVCVASLQRAGELQPLLERLGYVRCRDGDLPSRLFFVKGPPEARTHHLSLTEKGSPCWRDHVRFRDHLRRDPETARRYRRLKRALAETYPETRREYTAGKADFIRNVLERASRERS